MCSSDLVCRSVRKCRPCRAALIRAARKQSPNTPNGAFRRASTSTEGQPLCITRSMTINLRSRLSFAARRIEPSDVSPVPVRTADLGHSAAGRLFARHHVGGWRKQIFDFKSLFKISRDPGGGRAGAATLPKNPALGGGRIVSARPAPPKRWRNMGQNGTASGNSW